jgi:NADH dehydrogenase/NADH:ubiquinone oxidoreductase subunit G
MSKALEFGTPVKFKIGGRPYDGSYGDGLLDTVRRHGYEVPSLCHHEAVTSYGACRLCLVEVVDRRGRHRITTSCNYPVQPDIDVLLDTPEVLKHRRIVLELLLAMAPGSADLRDLAADLGVKETRLEKRLGGNDCILCGLCDRVCREVVGASAVGMTYRGELKSMDTPYDEANEACIACGACVWACPTNCIGLEEKDGRRTIVRWKRTLPLAVCEATGRELVPRFLLEHFAKRLGGFDDKVLRKAPPYR